MSFNQWVEFNINPVGFDATLEAKVKQGRLFQPAEKDYAKVNQAQAACLRCVNGTKIAKGKNYKLGVTGYGDAEGESCFQVNNDAYSCSPSGTIGKFYLLDGDKTVAMVHWYCPWGSFANEIKIKVYDAKYTVTAEGGYLAKPAKGAHVSFPEYNSAVYISNTPPQFKNALTPMGKIKITATKN